MKIVFTFLLYLLLSVPVLSQNLIPNYGFEVHDTCPSNTSQLDYCSNWINVENTSDFFHSCCTNTNASVPFNYPGYQSSHSGCGYAGILTYFASVPEFREYFQAKLITALTQGLKYYFSFYINLFNGFGFCSGTSKFGFKLSTMPFPPGNDGSPATDNTATFYTDSIVTDTVNWTKITGSIVADSAYQYITFGNFFDDAHTPYTILIGVPSSVMSYYYIDDVCLSPDSVTCISVSDSCYIPNGIPAPATPKDFRVFPDPFTDIIYITCSKSSDAELNLYDMTGRIIFSHFFNGNTSFPVSQIESGMYVYEIKSKGRNLQKGKLMKQ